MKSVDIGIIPGPHASVAHKNDVAKFNRHMEMLSDAVLAKAFEDANEAMGIRRASRANNNLDHVEDDDRSAFSEDILKITVNGPNVSYIV